MRNNPAITIVMWCYNKGEVLKQSIDSILRQTFSNFELILVNDHSHDQTQYIIEEIIDARVKVVSNKIHIGQYRVYNKYLKLIRSKYVSFVDPSFVFAKQTLEIQYNFLEKHPRAGCLGVQIKTSKQNNADGICEFVPEKHEDIKISLLKYNPFVLPSLLFRLSAVVNKKLLFNAKSGDCAFYDFMIDAARIFGIFRLKDELLITHSNTDALKEISSTEKSFENRNRLIIKQVANFKIKPKKAEQSLHLKLMTNQRLLASELEPMCQWLNKLIELNVQHKYYSQGKLYRFFDTIIKEKVATQLPNLSGITRSQLLNTLIKKYNYNSYLEIGVFDPKENFDLIDCAEKTAVDPEPLRDDIIEATSDKFFSALPVSVVYDLIFIDGLHHSDQVTRDIENALNHLGEQGTIVCHDMLPENEEMQAVPRKTVKWMGDCWKSWAFYRMTRENLAMSVIESDCGMGIIRRGRQKLFNPNLAHRELTYLFFTKFRNKMMNVISPSKFVQELVNSAL